MIWDAVQREAMRVRWRVVIAVAVCLWVWLALPEAMPVQQDGDLARRVLMLESAQADVRLARVETRLDAIQTVLTGVLIAVVTQLVLSAVGARKGGRPV